MAHLRDLRTGVSSSTVSQCSTFRSSVLASASFVTLRSDRTAHTAHLCSKRRSNMSHTEFHRVRQCWISLWSGIFCSCCFCLSAAVATVLWWKCDTKRLLAAITFFTVATLKPSLIERICSNQRALKCARREFKLDLFTEVYFVTLH